MLRVTSKPAASEIRNAGTWLTRPSPIVSCVKSSAASPKRHAVLDDADDEAADDVDERDDDAGDGVAADELAGTVHRPVEVGLLRDFLAAALGFALVDDAGVQVGVDRHLLAGHAVQGEAGGDFADARGALGDHDELNDDDDDEDDDADDDLAVAGDELGERRDHAAGRVAARRCRRA